MTPIDQAVQRGGVHAGPGQTPPDTSEVQRRLLGAAWKAVFEQRDGDARAGNEPANRDAAALHGIERHDKAHRIDTLAAIGEVIRAATPLPVLHEDVPTGAATVQAQRESEIERRIEGDSVLVAVAHHEVHVVVRDASLDAEAALRRAFDTAGVLTGRRASLRRLTLNGQMTYVARLPIDPK